MTTKLKEYREAANITRVGLAKASGVSRMTIYKIENGLLKDIKSTTMLKLADALHKSAAEIFLE